MNKYKTAISVKNLNVFYEKKKILEKVEFDVPVGVKCAIVGPNGAGKTTLIKTLLNLHDEFTGEFNFFEKKEENNLKRKIAYVPQRKNVDWNFPITVKDVVKMGTYDMTKSIFSLETKEILAKTRSSINDVGMNGYENFHINDLSGGQQQRIFVARALAQDPILYIMDEPFTGLDKKSEEAISKIFFKIQSENKTIIAVHHDFNTLKKYFDWIIFLNRKIIFSGKIENCNLDLLFEETFSF